jgi:uncharacterized protein YyaL (SSP411 family)
MEHESFEDAEVAKLLNDSFVAIKVDREEHPDVDQFYMDALHTMVARGGWPLNILATADRTPFFGGTYFPKHVFLQMLTNVRDFWAREPGQIREQGRKVLDHMKNGGIVQAGDFAKFQGGAAAFAGEWDKWIQLVGEQQLSNFDPVWGGFGGAPKFPRSHATSALLRAETVAPTAERAFSLRTAAARTLKGMAYGGMWDHVGGGFHRYSTDAEWHVPHFEKMLYDQALLVQTYAEEYLASASPLAKAVVEGTLNYLESEMRLESGAWAAAQDADSEGVEGKFFVWTRPEVQKVLGLSEGARFGAVFDVRDAGNWEGTNVLRLSHDRGADVWSDPKILEDKRKLLRARNQRVKPLRDDKILVSWNAWMASSLFQAAYALGGDQPLLASRLRGSALKTVEFLLKKAARPEDLARIYYGEESFEEALLEDHAALLESLQSALFYGALPREFDERFSREISVRLSWVEENFRDDKGRLLARRKDSKRFGTPWSDLQDEDGANPSAYSTYMGVLARELMASPRADLEERFWKDMGLGARICERNPLILTYLLNQLEIVARGAVFKAPFGHKEELLAKFAEKGYRPSEFLVVERDGDSFELCEWGTCLLSTSKRFEAVVALSKKLRAGVDVTEMN